MPFLAPVWAALIAALGWLVRTQIGFWIASALAAYGLSLVAQNFVVTPVMASIQSQMAGLGGNVTAWMAYLQVDKMLTTIISAYAAAASFSSIRLARKATP
jgi:type III secretory pathway component EscR